MSGSRLPGASQSHAWSAVLNEEKKNRSEERRRERGGRFDYRQRRGEKKRGKEIRDRDEKQGGGGEDLEIGKVVG